MSALRRGVEVIDQDGNVLMSAGDFCADPTEGDFFVQPIAEPEGFSAKWVLAFFLCGLALGAITVAIINYLV